MLKRLRRCFHLNQLIARNANPRDASRPIAFMHIPKSSGSALTTALHESIRPRLFMSGFDRSLFGRFDAFDTIESFLRREIHLESQPFKADFVAGHLSYSSLLKGCEKAQFITILREPRSRLLSHWLYWRTMSDDQLRPWGEWANYVRHGRKSLARFLSCADVASSTDNVTTRMLLWPHLLIPEEDFIDPRWDQTLIREAMIRLKVFAFVDIIENPDFQENIQDWIHLPFTYRQVNETTRIPPALRSSLHKELTREALDLLENRSRLDRILWAKIACQRVSSLESKTLAERTLIVNVARHSQLIMV